MATIDLSQLPAPDVVEALDYETLLAERKATLISLYPADQQEAVARTLTFESEPIVKLLQENAYRELILRQRINEAAKAVMVAYSLDGDLDQLGVNNGVTRLTITPADDTTIPPTPAVKESNDDFRLRIASAFEGLSVAGPTGAYEYHAKSADGRVADASAISPSPSTVTVTVLAREGSGVAGDDLLAVVNAALNDEDVRPVADRVTETQIQKLFAACKVHDNPDLTLIIKICLSTGCRWSEAANLKASQLSPNKITFINTKGKKNRSVPIDNALYNELKDKEGRFFAECYRQFYRVIRLAGIELPEGQMSHVLRHSFASHFMMAGGNIIVLQRILGHSDIRVTMRYAHFAPDHLEDAIRCNPLALMAKKNGDKVAAQSPAE